MRIMTLLVLALMSCGDEKAKPIDCNPPNGDYTVSFAWLRGNCGEIDPSTFVFENGFIVPSGTCEPSSSTFEKASCEWTNTVICEGMVATMSSDITEDGSFEGEIVFETTWCSGKYVFEGHPVGE